MYERILIVTRTTRLEDLIQRFNTRGQARFYIEHSGGDFESYQAEHDTYHRSLEILRKGLDLGLKVQVVERQLIPTYLFSGAELVVVLGQDGTVANVAKYAGASPMVAVNPDPVHFDGVLLPFLPEGAREAVTGVLEDRARIREVTMAEARLNDGQRLLAFNDLFIGAQSHTSFRCRVHYREQEENQSSSGVIVSTGAGSTGWLSSIFHMAAGVTSLAGGVAAGSLRLPWEDPRLVFVTREPFVSRHSSARLAAGLIEAGEVLEIESHMPGGGVIFSDGVEADRLRFDAGFTATLRAADQRARLVVA